MSHDHAAYMRQWRIDSKERTRARIAREALTHEAALLEATANRLGRDSTRADGITPDYLAGFRAAAGLVATHATQIDTDVSRGTST